MSEDLERVHIINLGKVLLSQPQHRAVRALNMVREFARRHMKTQSVKIDEDLARQIWARGARSPPRKIRVRMYRTDMGHILVSKYEGPLESEPHGDGAPAVGGSSAAGVVTATPPAIGTTTAGTTPLLPEPSADKGMDDAATGPPDEYDGGDDNGDVPADSPADDAITPDTIRDASEAPGSEQDASATAAPPKDSGDAKDA